MKRKCVAAGCGAPPAYTKMLTTKIERVVINALELWRRRDAGDLGNRAQ
jgi:hypothetical protein